MPSGRASRASAGRPEPLGEPRFKLLLPPPHVVCQRAVGAPREPTVLVERRARPAPGLLGLITGRVKELFKTSKGKYVAPAPIKNVLNRSSIIELSCVAGAGQPTSHALVQLAEHLHERRHDAAVRTEVTRELEKLLEEINRELPAYERLAFLVVVGDRWTIEDGSLTPTMKLKRSVIEARYAPALPGWYAAGQGVLWDDRPAPPRPAA